ncbi:senecionine N-oxygenase isoform X1 [Vanessa atalanta]|uniref:senecionine N-oxygenase isoform X1 n=1 Tax=Vanessa atalanta TaxID=42275 RepID=UPI001FCE0F60|nr:senecionine N-oxygenase isoform X1 [Vanessa atalanta]XP_047529490.1 senecionine N-oxygenase isoform X1 [Vanessa atalanta]XP_047529492.1 senecionine N-oxygenase isoform X1 [Vanessa atalanta]
MRVCIVGAGAAGLCAARHLLIEPCVTEVDVLEQSSQLGGTWVYTETVGYDDFGLPIHTSMYKSLRTNLPKEIMGFPDFPIPESERSYLPAKDMLAFLQLYAEKHGVSEHVKFKHHVQLIIPKQGATAELWDVTYKDLITGVTTTKEYDYVFVCNGHYNTPFIPNIPGLKEFEGDVMHSHDYRVPDIFKGKQVLVIGAGPSGMDIALEITSMTEKVILSHHLKEQPRSVFPSNLTQKPDVEKLEGRTAYFKDGSQEEIDVVFLCTGYLYNFPFLHESCNIVVEDNCVEPLYKHLVNIQHPTMCFIGVPYYVCAFSMFDLQVRYYVRSMNGTFKLPSREEMTRHWEQEKSERASRGYTRRQAHMMGPDQEKYYASLATEAGTESIPSVITKIREESSLRFLHNLQNYRQDVYKIIDDDTYEIISNGKREILC